MIRALLILAFISEGLCDAQVCNAQMQLSPQQKLKYDLLCNYDRSIRPVKDTLNQTTVRIGMYPVMVNMEEDTNTIEIHTWLEMTWNDEFLIWKPEDYGNLKYIHLEGSEIWLPDLVDFNRHISYNDFRLEANSALVFYYGRVLLTVLTEFNAHCKMDLKNWPNDRHTCGSVIGSKTYLGHHLDLVITNKSMNLTFYKGSRDWKLESVALTRKSATFKTNTTFVVALQCNFTMKRHSATLIPTIVLPTFGLVSLTLISFWQDPLQTARFGVLMVSAVGHFLTLHQLSWLIPSNADTPVLILNFLSASLLICICSLKLPLIYRNIITENPLPIWLNNLRMKISNSRMQLMLPLNAVKAHVQGSDTETIIDMTTMHKFRNDWLIIVNILDRLVFYLLIFVYLIMLIVMLSA